MCLNDLFAGASESLSGYDSSKVSHDPSYEYVISNTPDECMNDKNREATLPVASGDETRGGASFLLAPQHDQLRDR